MTENSIINCHTHTFTGDHVPPFLAKTYIPPPFHVLLPLRPIVALFRWWYKGPATWRYTTGYKKWIKTKTKVTAFFTRLFPLNIIAGYYLFFFAFFLLYSLKPVQDSWITRLLHKLYVWSAPAFPDVTELWMKLAIIFFVFIFFDSIRNFLFFIGKMVWKTLGKLPGKNTKEMIGRYLNIGRYAFHQQQKTILSKLKSQYPSGTGFVILPMDMDYMAAWKSKVRYRDQMQELADLKAMPSNKGILFPFVFADPRRMVDVQKEKRYKQGDKEYFSWTASMGTVRLEDCFIRDYIEDKKFAGIKIYPALGYYPFDAKLLPLWKYAADNKIPVLTHCIRGTIFYRGLKKQEWNAHPVFKQAMVKHTDAQEKKAWDGFKDDEASEDETLTEYVPLVLPQQKNVDFSYNFTHPMNYLCILEEPLLRQVVGQANDHALENLFGYNGPDKPMDYNLRELKICMGHFGGEDEWLRYFEKERYNYSSQLIKYPATGIHFFTSAGYKKQTPGKPEQLWKHGDWYSIICSMMLQYPNVYADISYILHGDKEILPLLKQTLQHEELKKKVLYGTDFFVVRNHKSDKNMLADMEGGLPKEDFKQIAVTNPRTYLSIQ